MRRLERDAGRLGDLAERERTAGGQGLEHPEIDPRPEALEVEMTEHDEVEEILPLDLVLGNHARPYHGGHDPPKRSPLSTASSGQAGAVAPGHSFASSSVRRFS